MSHPYRQFVDTIISKVSLILRFNILLLSYFSSFGQIVSSFSDTTTATTFDIIFN